MVPALQGTGRMALYAGLHPAQLKDSVTSMFLPVCVPYIVRVEPLNRQLPVGAPSPASSHSRTAACGLPWLAPSRSPPTSTSTPVGLPSSPFPRCNPALAPRLSAPPVHPPLPVAACLHRPFPWPFLLLSSLDTQRLCPTPHASVNPV